MIALRALTGKNVKNDAQPMFLFCVSHFGSFTKLSSS